MDKTDTARTINRHYIGVVKEINDYLKYVEVDIPQDDILIEEIDAMKENENRTIMDVQQRLNEVYPVDKFRYRSYDYLYPNGYSSAYVRQAEYPEFLTFEDYQKKLKSHEEYLNSEDYLLTYCDEKFELLRLKHLSEERYKERIKKIVEREMREYIDFTRKSFQYKRFLYAHRYTEELYEIKSDPEVRMWSTDQIGWKAFEYIVNDNITVYIKSNFGYGCASYFYCNLKYKEINILPYTSVVKYYYVKMIEFIRHTRTYAIERNSWAQVFDFAIEAANMAKHEPERFVKQWIVNEVEEMMVGIREVINSPKKELEYFLNIDRDIDIGSYRLFKNCSDTDRKDYEVLPDEKVLAFKAEKITGCLLLLDNLRSLTEIAPIIIPYIEEIEQMNRRLLPEIDSHIESLKRDIQRLEDNLAAVKKKIHSIVPTMKNNNRDIEKLRKKMNKAKNEASNDGGIYTHSTEEAEKEYVKVHPEYVQLKKDYDELKKNEAELEKRIDRRNRFLEILEKCKNRVSKYITAA